MSVLRVVVGDEHHGLRADRVLAELLAPQVPGLSRAMVQRWLEAGCAEHAGQALGVRSKLQRGQTIDVRPGLEPASSASAEPDVEFRLVHVDDELLVIDKPAGLVVHPARGHEQGTLVNGLLGRGLFAREQLEALRDPADGAGHDRPGIVHRIDKDTSGLLVVARTPRAREHLKEQFAAHSIDRVYTALAWGAVHDATLSTLHGRHPFDRLRFSSRVSEGKRAVTHVRALTHYGEWATKLEARLETGRTHQIRVHLADRGHGLLADSLYGKPPKVPALRQIADRLGRHALHAGVLGFVHPRSGERMRFESPWPADLQLAAEALAAFGGASDDA